MSAVRPTPSTTAPRFEAEWISAQHHDEFGEWEPDRDEYSCSVHSTFEAAKAASIAGSKRANVVEWCRVSEVHFNSEIGIPARHQAAWDTVRVWHGDWQGNWDEECWA